MSTLILAVLFFLGVSLVFYVLFAGADFGAGILELVLGSKRREDQRRLISHAMAPVWEANHIWLILAVVILFMGFPTVYTTASVYLHIPLIAVLVGIVARGCAFTFRHYDTLTRDYYNAYSRVFALGSVWTSFFLGTVGGALFLGKINPQAQDFRGLYLAPWLNSFCVVLGLFTCALFAFLAAVYLIGETEDPELQSIFRQKARAANIILVLLGALVFVTADLEGLPLHREFFANPISLTCFALATALLYPFWRLILRNAGTVKVRLLAAALVTLVLGGWFGVQYPIALRTTEAALIFQDVASPESTLRSLLGALIVGSCLIFPALGYLLRVFKWQTFEKEIKLP